MTVDKSSRPPLPPNHLGGYNAAHVFMFDVVLHWGKVSAAYTN